MAITLVFILFLSFTERFRDSNNYRIAQHNHNSGQRMHNYQATHSPNTSTLQFHVQALGPETRPERLDSELKNLRGR